MSVEECLICKHHVTQSGDCSMNVCNCLFFEEEPRGKMIQTNLYFTLDDRNASTPLFQRNSKIVILDGYREIEAKVIRINWVDLQKRKMCVCVEYHENEMPSFELRKNFRLVK